MFENRAVFLLIIFPCSIEKSKCSTTEKPATLRVQPQMLEVIWGKKLKNNIKN